MTIFGITLSAAVYLADHRSRVRHHRSCHHGPYNNLVHRRGDYRFHCGYGKFPAHSDYRFYRLLSCSSTLPGLWPKRLKVGNEKTNVDALVGREAMVTETIEPFGSGQAKVDGLVWSAIAKDSHTTIQKEQR